MKFARLAFFTSLLLTLFSLAFSAPVCCYSSGSGDIREVDSSICSGLNLPLPQSSACSEYEIEYCYNDLTSFNDYTVYNNDLIKSFLIAQGANPANFATCPISSGSTDPQIDPGTGDGEADIETPPTGGENPISQGNDDVNTDLDAVEVRDAVISCSQRGGFGGVFASQGVCEENSRCIYNPYLSGHFFQYNYIQGSQDLRYGFPRSENACIAKISITSCSEYRTQNNCEGNRATLDSEHNAPLLQRGCLWVDLGDSLLEDGLCIAKGDFGEKDFTLEFLGSRLNVIKNPSFEQDAQDWDELNSVYVQTGHAWHRDNYLLLQEEIELSQRVLELEGNTYRFGLSARKITPSQGGNLLLSYSYIDYNDNVLSGQRSISLDDLNGNLSVYSRLSPIDDIVLPRVKEFSFTLSLEGLDELAIDALSFQKRPESSSDLESTFVPVEIFPSKASHCELCAGDSGLGICTEERSEILGDCSYLVPTSSSPYSYPETPLQDTLTDKNPFLDSTESWNSQSLANSRVFCELYVHNNLDQAGACEDPNNYINFKFSGLHPLSAQTLCSWDEEIGCFKDSNGDNRVDVYAQAPFRRDREETFDTLYAGFETKRTIYEGLNNEETLSFEYACDVLPPSVYFYLKGIDQNTQEIVVFEDSSKTIGNLLLEIYSTDFNNLESCKDFISEVEYLRYIDIVVNGVQSSWPFTSRDVTYALSTLLEDGVNDISLRVLDQSGNVGDELNLRLENVDITAPQIILESPTGGIDTGSDVIFGNLGDTQKFTFSVSDFTAVSLCSYNLTLNRGEVLSIASGEFNLTSIENLQSFSYDLDLPIEEIENSITTSGDYFSLVLSCSDIFGQERIISSIFSLDYTTDLTLLEPETYVSLDLPLGYTNSDLTVNFASSDAALSSCDVSFNENVISDVTITSVPQGFTHSSYSAEFFTNISFTLPSSIFSDGENRGSISCSDATGNSFLEEFSYYYDTTDPQLLSYEFKGEYGEAQLVYYDGENDVFYIRKPRGVESILALDIENSFLFAGNDVCVSGAQVIATLGSAQESYEEEIFVPLSNQILRCSAQNSSLQLFDVIKDTHFFDVDTQSRLAQGRYNFQFSDYAGNVLEKEIDFYYDFSTPSFDLTSEDIVVDNELVISKVENPQITIGFASAEYRSYSCRVLMSKSTAENFELEFSGSSFTFTPSDFGYTLGETPIVMTLSCEDVYGEILVGSFNLYLDNTAPVLRSIDFSNSPYYIQVQGDALSTQYEAVSSSLLFDLGSTSELEVTCYYSVTDFSDLYDCDLSVYETTFIGAGIDDARIENLGLVAQDGGAQGGFLCRRVPTANQDIANSFIFGEDMTSFVEVSGFCQDKVGQLTDARSQIIDIEYVVGELVDIELEYQEDSVNANILSFSPFDYIDLYLEYNNRDFLVREQITGPSQREDILVYGTITFDPANPSELFPLNLPEGEYILRADAYLQGSVSDSIEKKLIVDKTAPELLFDVPDQIREGVVYDPNFELKITAIDNFKLDTIEVTINNALVFNAKNLSFIEEDALRIPSEYVGISSDKTTFDESMYYSEAQIGDEFTIVVTAVDLFGNLVQEELRIVVEDGLSIRLLESESAKVEQTQRAWLTQSSAPIIRFQASKANIARCDVLPFVDVRWTDVNRDEFIRIYNATAQVDLSQSSGFDLDTLGGTAIIGITCEYDGEIYNYNRSIKKITTLPDYVLESDVGFYLTDDYLPQITVRSVGIYDDLSCSYELFGQEVFLSTDFASTFVAQLDFEEKLSGSYSLFLECEDRIGNKGLRKEYVFEVDKSEDLRITDLTLVGNGREFENIDSEISLSYLTSEKEVVGEGYQLSFRTNKENAQCSYELIRTNFVSQVISFVASLFTQTGEEIEQSDIYSFESSSISFYEEGVLPQDVELRLSCTHEEFGSADSSFIVEFIEETSGLSVTREGLGSPQSSILS